MGGCVWVRGNQIIVAGVKDWEKPPVLTVPWDDHVSVLVNGIRVVGQTVVTPNMQISVLRDRKSPSSRVETVILPDALSVKMTVCISFGYEYVLLDSLPAASLRLAIKHRKLAPPRYTPEELRAMLANKGVCGEVDEEAIQSLARATTTTTRTVLRGIPFSQGQPATLCKMSMTRSDLLSKSTSVVLVAEGEAVARWHEGTRSALGRDVWGNELFGQALCEEPLIGAGLTRCGDTLVAVRAGRAIVTDRYAEVLPCSVIDGDLSSSDGDIVFPGDVTVNGSVLKGCNIHALGRVSISGSVFDSVIHADQGVAITGDVVHSTILAAPLHGLFMEITSVARDILDGLHQLLRDYRRLSLGNRFAGRILLTVCHGSVNDALDRFCSYELTDMKDYRQFMELVTYVQTTWRNPTGFEQRDIEDAIRRFTAFCSELRARLQIGVASVRAASFTSCTVSASGSVVVRGFGAFASLLDSGEMIHVRGAVRGGLLTARRHIHIHETGTPMGVETSVRVSDARGSVVVDVRYPRTLIEVAGRHSYNQDVQRDVVVRGGLPTDVADARDASRTYQTAIFRGSESTIDRSHPDSFDM